MHTVQHLELRSSYIESVHRKEEHIYVEYRLLLLANASELEARIKRENCG